MKQNTTDTNLTVSGLDAGSLYVIKGFPWDIEGREGEDSLYINQTTRKKVLGPFSVNADNMSKSNRTGKITGNWKIIKRHDV